MYKCTWTEEEEEGDQKC